jgi:molybdopterin-binding protein
MKLSARNVLKGKIKNIKRGPISSLVVLEIAPKVQIVSTITAESTAVIKASSVMVGVDE